jgi:hypothetical protein
MDGLDVAFPGFLAAVALTAGLAGQRAGQRLYDAPARAGVAAAARAGVRGPAVGLLVVVAGYLTAALATARPGLLTVLAAGLVLGSGYGLCLVAGLREVERLAAPGELGGLNALYYSLAYLGLAIPYLLALAAPHLGYPSALVLTAGAAALTLVAVLVQGRRPGGG